MANMRLHVRSPVPEKEKQQQKTHSYDLCVHHFPLAVTTYLAPKMQSRRGFSWSLENWVHDWLIQDRHAFLGESCSTHGNQEAEGEEGGARTRICTTLPGEATPPAYIPGSTSYQRFQLLHVYGGNHDHLPNMSDIKGTF